MLAVYVIAIAVSSRSTGRTHDSAEAPPPWMGGDEQNILKKTHMTAYHAKFGEANGLSLHNEHRKFISSGASTSGRGHPAKFGVTMSNTL